MRRLFPCVADLEQRELFAHDEDVPRCEGPLDLRELSETLMVGNADGRADYAGAP